ncbi:methionyl-tRNA formyltransferase [Marivibrio halodurans]|uniref:Methionyl-tRNA formyltransferase n=1 Tax=Marivibrio halodurans TaxID=2039722 RepID=A0A8J7V1N8_9PROT|nr:methionyl-tRNA formyltransferase [Marivibrio halodurans]MBP5857986.1 methionyl-tRNA formyltransferase [Marivibrio halodurans]
MTLDIAFMGTPDFSVPALDALVAAGHRIRRVYTQPPRPAGRGQQARPSPVHRAAERHRLDVAHPASLKDERELATFRALGLDAAVVVAYGLILPEAYLSVPRHGCLNIHASLLPRWRGAAPIQRAILAGDAETGISIMEMASGLDTGPVVLEEPVPIGPRTTAGDLHDQLSELGARLILEALDGLAWGGLHPVPQSREGITYAHKLEKAEGFVDWSHSARDIDRQLRALTPWPGCFFEYGGERLKLIDARPAEMPVAAGQGEHPAPGTILDADGTVACGNGALRLGRVQRPGRKPVPGDAFLRGMRLQPGDCLR